MDNKKVKKKSIVYRIWILVIMSILLSTWVIYAVSLLQAKSAIKAATSQRMLDIVNCAAGSVDGDILKTIQAEDEGTEDYQKIYQTDQSGKDGGTHPFVSSQGNGFVC